MKSATRSPSARTNAGERQLVQAAQQDPARFAELYDLNFERVYAYIARRVQDRSVAEDITADVFHKALAALPRFDWRGIPFAVWLLRIAGNVIADRWKQSAREVIGDPPEQIVETDLAEVEHHARVFRMVGELPEDQRQVIVLRFSDGRTTKEIAETLGRSEGAIKQLQFRGLAKLRSLLTPKRAGGKHV
jgi:RNA polymerase sigma-70 factor (ECF subfamily)